MLGEEQGAGGDAVDDQGAQEHGHDDVGGDTEGEKGNKGSLGCRIVGRFRSRHALDYPGSKLLRVLRDPFLHGVGDKGGKDSASSREGYRGRNR